MLFQYPSKLKHVYDIGDKTDEEVKNDVLIQLYNTGRIDGKYFGIESKSKENPIKGYINMRLKANGLDNPDMEYCNECYQTVFANLWKKPAEKIVEIVKESPNKLTATALVIVVRQCFAMKPNPNNSGIIHQLLNQSSYRNEQISTSEIVEGEDGDNTGQPLIIFDTEDVNEFNDNYGFTIEDVIERMTEEDKVFFYKLLDKQRVGRPSAKAVQERKELYSRINNIKKQIENEKNR